MLGKSLRRIWTWLGHVSTVAWLWSLGGGFVSAFLGSLFGDLAPWQLACLGVGTFFIVLAALGTWVRPIGEPTTTVETHTEPEEVPFVSLPALMSAIPGLIDRYPNLGGITPPTIVGELGTYIMDLYRTRRVSRPEGVADGALHDAETLLQYEEEFEDAAAGASEYLATRGIVLDSEVNDVRDIRRLARSLEEASDWEKWPR